jgi:hypothetical protein
MNREAQFIARSKAVLLWLTITVWTSLSFSQTPGRAPTRLLATRGVEKPGRFIVAFELSPESGFTFTWPYESMRPAIYDTVLIKVIRTPHVIDGYSRQSKPLLASRTMKINGALQRPLRLKTTGVQQQFKIRLHQGRLRFALTLPENTFLDPQYKIARIELYEINREENH